MGNLTGAGQSAVARYSTGVRALFVGPSGTGKTLAAGWLATRLGIPLFRVDLAAVTSKYIGETEKHMAQLLTRAEQSEVVLLFDEADSLFGKRTDVKDSNARFANSQTNYLLRRIEQFDGITLLTSNSRSRFDAAFTRRLDVIVEFQLPGPEQRRAIWQSHLGQHHRLPRGEMRGCFVTYLIARPVSGGALIFLRWCTWSVSWAGSFSANYQQFSGGQSQITGCGEGKHSTPVTSGVSANKLAASSRSWSGPSLTPPSTTASSTALSTSSGTSAATSVTAATPGSHAGETS